MRRYEREQLRGVVTAAGFRVETLRWLDASGVIPWFLAGRVLRQRRFSPGLARLYDRVVVPVSRALEERVEPPWGKNLICIARRDL